MAPAPPAPVLVCAALVVLLLVAAALAPRARRPRSAFGAGPYGIQLYDAPYRYPVYEARAALRDDVGKRCAAFCMHSPCHVWCREAP